MKSFNSNRIPINVPNNIVGNSNLSYLTDCIIIGNNIDGTFSNNIVFGDTCGIDASISAISIGNSNIINNSENSTIFGNDNIITICSHSKIYGKNNNISYVVNSTILGNDNIISLSSINTNLENIFIGSNNNIVSNYTSTYFYKNICIGNNSILTLENNEASGFNVIIGYGINQQWSGDMNYNNIIGSGCHIPEGYSNTTIIGHDSVASVEGAFHYNGLVLCDENKLIASYNSGEPSGILGTGADASGSIDIIGTNGSFKLTITTGEIPLANNIITTITFSLAYTGSIISNPILFPGNVNSALLNGTHMIYAEGTNSTIVLKSGSAALIGNTEYIWNVSSNPSI